MYKVYLYERNSVTYEKKFDKINNIFFNAHDNKCILYFNVYDKFNNIKTQSVIIDLKEYNVYFICVGR